MSEGHSTYPAEDPCDESLHHWQKVIACLPSAAKRDAAWEFYTRRFAHAGSAADLLSGLVLLLEAHSLFLEQLPERYHTRLVEPLDLQQTALRTALDAFQQRQDGTLATLEKVSECNASANARAVATVATVENALRQAAISIDAQAIVEGVKRQLEEKALAPLADALATLAEKTCTIEQTSTAAQSAIERWRRVHLGGVVLCGWGAAALVCATLFLVSWEKLNRANEKTIAAERESLFEAIQENQEILRRLADLRLKLHLRSVADPSGSPIPDALEFSIEPEQQSDVRLQASEYVGVTYLRTAHAQRTLERLRTKLRLAKP